MKSVSVIVVSNGRADALLRCLTGVGQLQYAEFEIVVVADSHAAEMLRSTPWADTIKIIPFDTENISAARNTGIASAAGEVLAFIDDDAVPEPAWLIHLIAAFDDAEVSAAGGFVRGRNGISFQWKARHLDRFGESHPIRLQDDRPVVLYAPEGQAIKTEGTNMAFRREVLAGLGGFDPAFRFYLDESDTNMRLARAGHATALVPLAQVHHGFAPSNRRRSDRVPRDLFEIGASHAAFLLRHAPAGDVQAAKHAFRKQQRIRLLNHMVAGRLEPRDVVRLMSRLDRGFGEGAQRQPQPLPAIARARDPFRPFASTAPHAPKLHVGRWKERIKIRQRAARDVAAGHMTTVMLFSPTSFYGHVSFSSGGFWEHRGGQFGKMERSEPPFKVRTLKEKAQSELNRISLVRGLSNRLWDRRE